MNPFISHFAFKQETLLLETGIPHSRGGFRIEFFICSVWSSWRNYFASWLKAKEQGTNPPCSISWFGTSLCRAKLVWTWAGLASCLCFPSFWAPWSSALRKDWGDGAFASHWGYLPRGTAAVALSRAAWSTSSAPTTSAMPFVSLLGFYPSLSAFMGRTWRQEQVSAEGVKHSQDRA